MGTNLNISGVMQAYTLVNGTRKIITSVKNRITVEGLDLAAKMLAGLSVPTNLSINIRATSSATPIATEDLTDNTLDVKAGWEQSDNFPTSMYKFSVDVLHRINNGTSVSFISDIISTTTIVPFGKSLNDFYTADARIVNAALICDNSAFSFIYLSDEGDPILPWHTSGVGDSDEPLTTDTPVVPLGLIWTLNLNEA